MSTVLCSLCAVVTLLFLWMGLSALFLPMVAAYGRAILSPLFCSISLPMPGLVFLSNAGLPLAVRWRHYYYGRTLVTFVLRIWSLFFFALKPFLVLKSIFWKVRLSSRALQGWRRCVGLVCWNVILGLFLSRILVCGLLPSDFALASSLRLFWKWATVWCTGMVVPLLARYAWSTLASHPFPCNSWVFIAFLKVPMMDLINIVATFTGTRLIIREYTD